MAEIRIDLSGIKGLIAVAVVAAVVALRFASMQNVTDEQIRKRVTEVIAPSDLGTQVDRMREMFARGDGEGMTDTAKEMLHGPRVTFHRLKMSRPLLSWENRQKVVIYADYEIVGDPENRGRQKKYMVFLTRGSVGSWEYRHETGYLSYLLNF